MDIEITALEFEKAYGYRPAKAQGNGGIEYYKDDELITVDFKDWERSR